MPKKVTVSILGATGYTGLELIRFLVNHPQIELASLVSHSHSGKKISELWPHLQGICDLTLKDTGLSQVAHESDVVFLALPHHETQKIVQEIIGITKIIDLSADFRIQDLKLYEKYYGHAHHYSEGTQKFVYGLPEAFHPQIVSAQSVANPGCFAIVSQLALLPLKGMIMHASIVAVTGSSGSGKTPKEGTHHPIRNHNLASYKIGTHQHIPEIIKTLGIAESEMTLVPTSGPLTRGIHLTAFVDLSKALSEAEIIDQFKKTYAQAPFVRLKSQVQLAEVIGSNFCDVAVNIVDGKLVIQSVIDNLGKGAAGNAIQNMNIMCGFDEAAGLKTISPLFP